MQEEATVSKKDEGRQARTKGVSLSPEELQLVQRYEELTGLGFTDQVRHTLLSKLPASIAIVEDMVEAGMTIGPLPTEYVIYAETAEERQKLYQHTFEPVEARQEEAAVG
jgi:hypothetical protein